METLFAPLGELEEYDQLIRGIKQGEFPVQLIGCMDTQESHMIYGTGRDKRIRLVITHNEVRAKELVEDLKLYDHDVMNLQCGWAWTGDCQRTAESHQTLVGKGNAYRRNDAGWGYGLLSAV